MLTKDAVLAAVQSLTEQGTKATWARVGASLGLAEGKSCASPNAGPVWKSPDDAAQVHAHLQQLTKEGTLRKAGRHYTKAEDVRETVRELVRASEELNRLNDHLRRAMEKVEGALEAMKLPCLAQLQLGQNTWVALHPQDGLVFGQGNLHLRARDCSLDLLGAFSEALPEFTYELLVANEHKLGAFDPRIERLRAALRNSGFMPPEEDHG